MTKQTEIQVPETGQLFGPAILENFASKLRGYLLLPGNEGYEKARTIHNGMIDRKPALIVRCAGVADIMYAIQFAKAHQLPLSVHSGGHSVAGFSVCEAGLMLDLSLMKGIHVDPATQTARAEAGVTWGDFDQETQAFGLATTGGLARPTGIAGLTLGGGHGFLMRKYGLACDNLLSADVVTADGELLKANQSQHADLFWGIRGGGGNFGIVTSFEYRLYPVSEVLGGLLIYPMAVAGQVLNLYAALTSTAPDALGSLAVLATLPDGTAAVVLLICYSGEREEGERLLEPLRTFTPIIADQVSLLPYKELQSIVEKFNPAGLRNYWKSAYLKALTAEAIHRLLAEYTSVPSPITHIVIEHMGGAVSRVDNQATAVSHRQACYNLLIVGMWTQAAEDERNLQWVRQVWQQMQPFSLNAVYVNYEADQGADRIKAAYEQEKYDRLVKLKGRYDPTNVFQFNPNIRPA